MISANWPFGPAGAPGRRTPFVQARVREQSGGDQHRKIADHLDGVIIPFDTIGGDQVHFSHFGPLVQNPRYPYGLAGLDGRRDFVGNIGDDLEIPQIAVGNRDK